MKYVLTTDVVGAANEFIRVAPDSDKYAAVMTLGGDRARACDEAIVAKTNDGTSVGMATISPQGEDGSGQPEIVGVFVLPTHRGSKHGRLGRKLLLRALRRCASRGFTTVHMSVTTRAGKRLVVSLPKRLPVSVTTTDLSHQSLF